jgi:hypothetical protein
MGSGATGYDNDGDDNGDGRDDNDATTMMATAHQAGYYATYILNWKKMFDHDNDDDGNSDSDIAMGNGATGYDNDYGDR